MRSVWWLLASVMVVGCRDASERTELRPTNLKADLETLAGARIFFGHQSVGYNVLEGVASLAAQEGVALRIIEVPGGLADAAPGIVHATVGRNREPETKCDAFGRFFADHAAARWDAAVLKFCYADLGDGSDRDPDQLMESYKRTVASVQAARPGMTLVHATLPLQSDGLGKRNAIKRMIGLGTSNDEDNTIRNRFNDLLRAEFRDQPLFDVAWAESTRPDGTRSGFMKDGRLVLTMAREFTYDEGHLTDAGRQWVAREFVRSLAVALRGRDEPAREPARSSD